MRTVVFGASGRTDRPLVGRALERGHEVVASVRGAEGFSSSVEASDRLGVVEGDAYGGGGVDRAVGGEGDPVDAVVSVLGQRSGGSDDLLTEAGGHVLDAMDRHGVDRYVTLVGAGVREESESVSLGDRAMGSLLRLPARSMLEDAVSHVEAVKTSGGDWTVVRGPRLTEAEHTGEFDHGTDLRPGARDAAAWTDVAEFVPDRLESKPYVREMPKIADA